MPTKLKGVKLSVWLFILLPSTHTLIIAQTKAQSLCSVILGKMNPKARFVGKSLIELSAMRLFNQWKKSTDESYQKISNNISKCIKGTTCPLNAFGSEVETIGRVEISEGKVPIIKTELLRSAAVYSQTKKLHSGRSDKTDFTTANYFGAVLDGLMRYAEKNPEVEFVVISGESVMNNGVKILLSSLGFLPGSTNRAIDNLNSPKEDEFRNTFLRLVGRYNPLPHKWSLAISVR